MLSPREAGNDLAHRRALRESFLGERTTRGLKQTLSKPHGQTANHNAFGIENVDQDRERLAQFLA